MQEYALRSEYATTIAPDQHARSVMLAALDLATGETSSFVNEKVDTLLC